MNKTVVFNPQAEITELKNEIAALKIQITKMQAEILAGKYAGPPFGNTEQKSRDWYQPYQFPESPYSLSDIICNKIGDAS